MAAVSKIQECALHCLKRFGLSTKVGRARFRQRLDLRTGAITIGPKPKQLSDLFNRKAEIAGIGYEAKPMDLRIAVVAIATVPPRRRRDQAYLLIMADHPL